MAIAHRLNPKPKRAAATAWVITLALVAVCLWLAVLNRLSLERLFSEYIIAVTIAAVSSSSVGALIVARRPENRVGWLLCAAGLGLSLVTGLQQFVRFVFVTQPVHFPYADVFAWVNRWIWFPVIALFLLFLPLVFPTGRLPSPRWRWLLWTGVACTLAQMVSLAISPGAVDASLHEVGNPFSPPWAGQVKPILDGMGLALGLVSLAGAVAAPVIRLRGASGVERQQIKWFAFAAGVMLTAFLLPILVHGGDFTADTLLSGILLSVGFPVLPAAVGVAVLRYRLYDIDILIRRTLVYTTLTIILAVLYLGSVVVLQSLLHWVTGANSDLAIITSTLAIAALFRPLRLRIQAWIDRRFYRRKYNAERILAAFSAAARDEVDVQRLSERLIAAVDDNLQVEHISFWLNDRV